MEDFDPAEDFVSPAAAKLMDTAFGLNGMARWIATEAQIMEHRERARLRKQRQRDNARILADAHKENAPLQEQRSA
jgi:hypothetical protein